MMPVATTPVVVSSRLPAVTESPRVSTSTKMRNMHLPPKLDEQLEVDMFKLDGGLPPPQQQQLPMIQSSSHHRGPKADRLTGAHSLGSNPKCIPPWPVKGDVILLRGPQGDFHGVVRDVRVQSKQMRLGILHRLSSDTRWSVREEETVWRSWHESVRTLDFWIVVRWASIPGRGYEKFPMEWQVR